MNFPFYIARRYVFSKKSTNAINIISAISVVGVAVATMALVIVMSVFNGFHDMVASFLTNFDPQIEVLPAKGKTISCTNEKLERIKALPQVDVATECVEDLALAILDGRQAMVTIMGVDDNFDRLTHIKEILYGEGEYCLHAADLEYGIPGIRLAQNLISSARWNGFMHIYAPQREGQLADMDDPSGGFVVDSLVSPGVVFAVNQSKYDKDHILTSINFARNLFGMQDELTSLKIRLKPGSNLNAAKEEMREIAGDELKVLDRFEQQADIFRIMQIEKVLAYAFLTFILIVACFNIISSISMLMIDKKEDADTLRKLGASDKQIAKIFMYEGRIISALGAIVGILLGLLLCWLQQEYGFVTLGNSSGNYIINAYPVSVHYIDVLMVFITVTAIGWTAVWIPVRKRNRQNNKQSK